MDSVHKNFLLNKQGIYLRALDDCSKYSASGGAITTVKNWTDTLNLGLRYTDIDPVFHTHPYSYFLDGLADNFYLENFDIGLTNQNGYLTFFFNGKTGRTATGGSQVILNYGRLGDDTGYIWNYITTSGYFTWHYERADINDKDTFNFNLYDNDDISQHSLALLINFNANPVSYRYSIDGDAVVSGNGDYPALFPIPTSKEMTVGSFYLGTYGFKNYLSHVGCFWNYHAADTELIRIAKELKNNWPL